MILEDEELEEEIIDYLRSNKSECEVWQQVKSSINKLKLLSEIDDEYLKERAGEYSR